MNSEYFYVITLILIPVWEQERFIWINLDSSSDKNKQTDIIDFT